MAAKKYYVVWKGYEPGVYDNWIACKRQIDGYTGAQFKSYTSLAEANSEFLKGFSGRFFKKDRPVEIMKGGIAPIPKSICVDAACSGNPGTMEYRAVNTISKKEIFKMGPFDEGTNNIGEFLAIVHALALLTQQNDMRPIYSDSETAIGWVKRKKCNTKLTLNKKNAALFDLIARAENWLNSHTVKNSVLKWETENWGENPADFGRK